MCDAFKAAFINQSVVSALVGFPERPIRFNRIENPIQADHVDGAIPTSALARAFPFSGTWIRLVERISFYRPQHMIHSFNQLQVLKGTLLADLAGAAAGRIGLV